MCPEASGPVTHALSFLSLTFDDGLVQHLDYVVPALDDLGLPGTFYAHLSSDGFASNLERWRLAAKAGHELGNHTIFHPAYRRKPWVREGNAIERYTLDRMDLELTVANRLLQGIDGRTDRTFAYPCSTYVVGDCGWPLRFLKRIGLGNTRLPAWLTRLGVDFGSQLMNYEPVVRKYFVAARGGGLTAESPVPSLDTVDRFCLPSVAVDQWPLEDLQRFAERGLAGNTWGILQFHGIGGGHGMDCDLQVFRRFARWLADNHGSRVVTVRDGAKRVWGQAKTGAREGGH